MAQPKLTDGEINQIVTSISIPNGRFRWDYVGDGFYIQVLCMLPDVYNPATGPVEQRGRKWYVSAYSVESEVIQTCLYAWLKFMEHEARENFQYEGVRLFNPHISARALMSVADKTEVRL